MTVKTARPMGRPPASNSAETRERILDEARQCFAQFGFEATTNRTIADAAGITTGAIYHYFESKVDTYVAVHERVRRVVYQRFTDAIDFDSTFQEMFATILDVAHELNAEDPSLAQFLGSARVDFRRHPDLAAAIPTGTSLRGSGFIGRMIDRGIETGEIEAGDRDRVDALIATLLTGLTDAVSEDQELHRQAVEAVKAVMAGRLFKPCR